MLYADLTADGKLLFEFEIYRNEQFDFDYEFKQTVEQEEFAFTVTRIGLRQYEPMLSDLRQITACVRGQHPLELLTSKEIKTNFGRWGPTKGQHARFY